MVIEEQLTPTLTVTACPVTAASPLGLLHVIEIPLWQALLLFNSYSVDSGRKAHKIALYLLFKFKMSGQCKKNIFCL